MDFDVCCNSSKPISHGFWVIILIVSFALWYPVEIFIVVLFLNVCYGSKFAWSLSDIKLLEVDRSSDKTKKKFLLMDFDTHCNSSKSISHGLCVITQIVIFVLWFPVKIFEIEIEIYWNFKQYQTSVGWLEFW